MATKLGVLFVHGMGDHPSDFGSKLEARMRHALRDYGSLFVERCMYSEAMGLSQRALWERMTDPTQGDDDLDGGLLRKWARLFSLHYLADAVGYVESVNDPEGGYRRAHRTVRDSLATLRQRVQGGPIAIVAHSLGAKVISDYFWDLQQGRRLWQGASQEERDAQSRDVRRLLTFGCNIPLFVCSAVDPQAFDRARMGPGFEWTNYYERDDLLGWPLRPLSPSYYALVRDVDVDTVLRGRMLAAHLDYWTDRRFAHTLIERLASLVS